jgi:ATP adenylyltransferase
MRSLKMDRLWAPWRIKYLKASANICGGKKPKKCIFCKCIKSGHKNYVILKSRYSFAVLNIFPYNNGHLMVSPIRHIRELSQLNNIELLDLFQTLNNAKKMLDRALNPDGYNIGLNTSASAGAGETRHLHIHIVPRWKGDVNFMTSLYDTKVISQSLDGLYKQLREAQTYGTK